MNNKTTRRVSHSPANPLNPIEPKSRPKLRDGFDSKRKSRD